MGRLMKRLGFSPQRPLYRACSRTRSLRSWQETEYPKIAISAKKEGALIFFADEAGVRSTITPARPGRRWGPADAEQVALCS